MNLSSAFSGHLMAVKTLKKNFGTLAYLKPIFVKFKSVSVIKGLQVFLLQSRLIWLTVLSSIFGFMTSMR